MKKSILFLFALVALMSACTKSGTSSSDSTSPIITVDSSQFNGRLYVYTYDDFTSAKLSNTDVFLYTNYDDIKRGIYLFYRKSNVSAEADFGYLLQGNYYIVAKNSFKTDTSLVQVTSKRTINKNVFLR
ncbi:MAG: hypothetical protein CFE21_15295 [Bacteroidetes bacterium B1(2017)]|nr:MAG: hypothetical protein CFE21_15295 [Bacteroidetes bacterium B1(2017)]